MTGIKGARVRPLLSNASLRLGLRLQVVLGVRVEVVVVRSDFRRGRHGGRHVVGRRLVRRRHRFQFGRIDIVEKRFQRCKSVAVRHAVGRRRRGDRCDVVGALERLDGLDGLRHVLGTSVVYGVVGRHDLAGTRVLLSWLSDRGTAVVRGR